MKELIKKRQFQIEFLKGILWNRGGYLYCHYSLMERIGVTKQRTVTDKFKHLFRKEDNGLIVKLTPFDRAGIDEVFFSEKALYYLAMEAFAYIKRNPEDCINKYVKEEEDYILEMYKEAEENLER